ncbi:metallophosphoesterase [Microbacterium sufflavum]
MGTWTRARRRALAVVGATVMLVGALVPAVASAADETFTIVVLPDTQGYTVSSTYEQTMAAQTQWIVDSRAQLNTKFVIQVGDLVESWPNVNHWERASRYMKTLDDAGVPNSVLPGNHDLDITTGESSTYDNYFPPSRYSAASWNSPTVSYGGYLGQNQFGPDGIDRKNKDSYSLLTVGDTKLLLLSLEFESPAYTLAWAQRVLDAHPDRKVILATHGFINTGGTRATHVIRTDVTPVSAVTLWNDFVSQNCSIFFVVNGHWHDGDIGEARRTDPNSCGTPVHQILSNYQSRANGGNGWLRYYTFDPAAGTVDAFTYSPTLQQYETDAGSRFTLPVDLEPGTDEVLLAGGSTWKWRNSTQAWPTGWTTLGFDDSGWGSGRAPLGWGTGAVTSIDLGPPSTNRARAMLFRTTVTLADIDELSGVTVSTRADDGVAVWVNGTLLGTSHLQSTAPTSATYADAVRSTSVATADPAVFAVPSGLLREGANVIAASAHVNYRGTPDSTFDLVMTARRTTVDPPQDPPGAPAATATATSPTSVDIAWSPGPGGAVSGVEVSRPGMTTLTGTGATGVVTDAAAPAGSAVSYAVVAIGPDGARSAATTVSVTTPPAATPVPVTLVRSDAAWRFRYAAGAWPTGWTGVAFDDTAWGQGAAPLGFGSGITTVVDVPPPTTQRPISMLFRTSFTVTDPAKLSELVLTARADDGAVVTVNGVEVGRLRMPTTTVTSTTYATAAPNTAAAVASPLVIPIPASSLRAGVNVIAVSTHLNYRSTPGVSFVATLEGKTLP